MKFDLQVSRKTFSELVRTHNQLAIPAFQRPYAWKMEQWEQLWQDLTTHLDQDYLMGSVVLCGTDNRTELVIDGQQRMATITLLIAVCRDYLWRECQSESAKENAVELHREYVVSGGVVAKKTEPYIVLGELDRDWFAKRIQVSPRSEGEYSPPDLDKIPYKQPGSNRLLWRAYQYFYKELQKRHAHNLSQERKVADVIEITRQAVERTWFVITRVPDDTQAYMLFEVLNDRGLELSISDLIKNVILAHAADLQRLTKAKEYWDEIVDLLDYENIASFLRYHWMSKHGKKITENDLFLTLKKEIKEMNAAAFVAYLKLLATEAANFAELIKRAETSEEISKELILVNAYGFRVGHTVLLAIWSKTENEKTRLEVLREVKNFLVKFAIFANHVTNKLEGVMAEIASAIRGDLNGGLEVLRTKFKAETPVKDAIKAGFLALEPTIPVARALLIEIESYLAGNEKMVAGTKSVNVEHIFPQSPSDEWIASFGAGGEEDSYTGRLGNMTLLASKLNKQASNKPYVEKWKNCYSESDFTITNQLPKIEKWTYESVNKRQNELYESARKIWKVD